MKLENLIKNFYKQNPWAKEYKHSVELAMQTYFDYKITNGDDIESRKTRKLLADSFNRQATRLYQLKPKEEPEPSAREKETLEFMEGKGF